RVSPRLDRFIVAANLIQFVPDRAADRFNLRLRLERFLAELPHARGGGREPGLERPEIGLPEQVEAGLTASGGCGHRVQALRGLLESAGLARECLDCGLA